MNNSKIAFESIEPEIDMDKIPILRKQVQEIGAVVEALEKISSSSYWKVLKERIFDDVLENLTNKLKREKEINEIFRLQGQITMGEKHLDLASMLDLYRNRLQNIKKTLDEQQ